MAVNHFLRERFPSKTWTSIAVLYNPSMPLHRDILNMIGHANHAVALGNFLEGRVWIEDENGQATTVLKTKNGQKLLHGTWIDMHDAPVTFNARKYHVGSCSIYASSVQACCCLPHQQAYGTWLSSSCLTASIATVSTQASPSYSEPTHSGMSFDFVAGRFHEESRQSEQLRALSPFLDANRL